MHLTSRLSRKLKVTGPLEICPEPVRKEQEQCQQHARTMAIQGSRFCLGCDKDLCTCVAYRIRKSDPTLRTEHQTSTWHVRPQPAFSTWLASQSADNTNYLVNLLGGSCTCKFFSLRRRMCKHMWWAADHAGFPYQQLPSRLRQHPTMSIDMHVLGLGGDEGKVFGYDEGNLYLEQCAGY
jgi:hypothetical protein